MSVTRQLFAASVLGAALSLGMAGCATQRPDVIPASAQIQTSGNGPINFTAPNDGMAYVYDASSNRLLWSGPVRAGQIVNVDPQKNQIALGNQVVAMRTLQPGDHLDVYFDPTPGVQPAGAPMERQPMERQPAPPPPQQGNYPQGTGATPTPSGGTTVNGQGVIVTPSVTVTPTNPNQQQQLQPPPPQQPPQQQQPSPPPQQPSNTNQPNQP
jgi:hypothetical protein